MVKKTMTICHRRSQDLIMGVALCFGKPVWISVLDRDLCGCLYILLSSGEASGFEGGGGSGGGATSGSRGRAPGQGVREAKPPPEVKAF